MLEAVVGSAVPPIIALTILQAVDYLPLGIRLVTRNLPEVPGVSGIEVDFDDVRLDVAPLPAVPVLPAAAWAALAVALAVLGSRVALRGSPAERDAR